MRIVETGKISDHIVFLGDIFFPAYFIAGRDIALVDSGVGFIAPGIVRAFQEYFGPDAEIDWNLLTHSHFDHLGGTPFLKRVFPGMKVMGSPVINKVLSNPRAISLIRKLSGDTGDLIDEASGLRLSFDGFVLDQNVTSGYRLDLGKGVEVSVIETPGHSRCSVAYFVEPDRAIFMSEASGVPLADWYIQSEFLSDNEAYMDSLKRMADSEPCFICLPHGGVLTGEDAAGYFERSAEAARVFKAWITDLLAGENGDEQKVVERIYDEEWAAHDIPQDKNAYMVNLRAMVRAVKKELTPLHSSNR